MRRGDWVGEIQGFDSGLKHLELRNSTLQRDTLRYLGWLWRL